LALNWLRETITLTLVFSGVALAITWLGVILVPPSEAQGVLRPTSEIPLKALLLLTLGLSIGAAASLAARRLNLSFIVSGGILTLLLDLDHLPSAFKIPQPIRPAHSIIFLIAVSAIVYLSTRKVTLATLSAAAFFAHLGSDKSFYPLLSPIVFDITTFGPEVSLSLVLLAYALAFITGQLEKKALATSSQH